MTGEIYKKLKEHLHNNTMGYATLEERSGNSIAEKAFAEKKRNRLGDDSDSETRKRNRP